MNERQIGLLFTVTYYYYYCFTAQCDLFDRINDDDLSQISQENFYEQFFLPEHSSLILIVVVSTFSK